MFGAPAAASKSSPSIVNMLTTRRSVTDMAELEHRDRVRRAGAACSELPMVVATGVVDPETEPRETWVLELTVDGGTVPPEVLRELAIEKLDLLADQTATRGEPTHTIVAAAPY